MNIPRYDDVALLLMAELRGSYGKRALSLADVAKSHGLSPLFLKKIARTLVAADLVDAREGKNGGYLLAKPPRNITVWDILRAFSAQEELDTRNPGMDQCPIIKDCLPQRVHRMIDNTLKNGFSRITLAEI